MAQSPDKTGSATQTAPDDETRKIHQIAAYAFLLNVVLAVMKGALASFSGSLAIVASAMDSGTDAVASLFIYLGVKLSIRKTRSFPLGLYKLENVASVVIALFIFLAGYEILRETLSPKAAAPFIPFSYLLLLLAATVATLVFGRYALATGRKTGSPTLIAEGRHRQVDAISSVVVLVSAVFSYLKVPFSVFGVSVDQLGAVLILVFIVHAGWGLLSDGMRVLLDASIDFTTLDEIRKVIEREPLVSEVTSLVGRSAGRFRFIQATVALRTGDLQKAHRVSEQIEIKIRRQVPNLERVLIHYEPVEKPYRVIALPLEDASGKINRHFGEAPYFGVIRLRNADGRIEKQEVIENPHRSVETGKGIRVAEWLVEKGVDLVGMKEDLSKKGPGYVFANAGVKTHLISSDGIPEALSEIGSGVP